MLFAKPLDLGALGIAEMFVVGQTARPPPLLPSAVGIDQSHWTGNPDSVSRTSIPRFVRPRTCLTSPSPEASAASGRSRADPRSLKRALRAARRLEERAAVTVASRVHAVEDGDRADGDQVREDELSFHHSAASFSR